MSMAPAKRNNSLRAENISYAYPLQESILENISLEVSSGDIILLTGANGVGKTTLLKLLAGIYLPTRSQPECNLKRDCHVIPLIQNGAGLNSELNLMENMRLLHQLWGFKRGFWEKISGTLEDRLAPYGPTTPKILGKLSTGMLLKTQLELAIAQLSIDPNHIMVMDEVLGHLDENARKVYLDRLTNLAETGAAFVISTHAPQSLDIQFTQHWHLDHTTKSIKIVEMTHDILP